MSSDGGYPQVEIRRAVRADEEPLLDLTRAFATSFVPQPASFRVAFNALRDRDDARLLVAVESDHVIGYLTGFDHYALFAGGRVAWIEELMVAERSRRRRVGRSLMQAFEGWAWSRGAKLIALATRRAAAFYESLGYVGSADYFRKLP